MKMRHPDRKYILNGSQDTGQASATSHPLNSWMAVKSGRRRAGSGQFSSVTQSVNQQGKIFNRLNLNLLHLVLSAIPTSTYLGSSASFRALYLPILSHGWYYALMTMSRQQSPFCLILLYPCPSVGRVLWHALIKLCLKEDALIL